MEKYSKNISGIFHVLAIQSLSSNSFIGSKVISSSNTGKMSLRLKDEDIWYLQTLHATNWNNSMVLKYGNYINVPIYTYISLYTSGRNLKTNNYLCTSVRNRLHVLLFWKFI